MKRFSVLAGCAALCAATAGCGGGDALDEHTWCAKVAEVQCRWIYSCCNVGERLALLDLNAHEESEPVCREQVTASCLEQWDVPLASIQAGRLAFALDSADACLAAMREQASQCGGSQEQPDECKTVTTGLVGMDGECAYDAECAGQARCRRLGTGASGRCYDKSGVDGLCQSSLDCQEGLFCYQGSMIQYVCVPLDTVGAGETCSSAGPYCASGYYCDGDVDRCVAKQGAGAACGATTECQDGLVCDATGHCGAGIGLGQSCSYYSDYCAVGLYCSSSTYQCTQRLGAGGACYYGNECDTSLYCDTSGQCSARHASGDGCTSGSDSCLAGLACLPRGNCQASGDVGSECYSDDQCLARLRCNPDTSVCEMQPTRLGEGEFCQTNAECQSNACVTNVCVAFCSGEQ